jgi:uncharacterized protein DUF3892
MARYRIICTNQDPPYQPTTHAHIVAVGTGTSPDHYDQKWTLNEVLAAMDRGNTFYTQGRQSGRVAEIEKYTCSTCRRIYIRSAPDAIPDNNLDNLPRCT